MYSALLILKYSGGFDDFSDVCEKYIGKWAQILVCVASLIILLGALTAYNVLLSDSLFSIVNTIRQFFAGKNFNPASDVWKRQYVPLFIVAILFPICNTKTINFLLKLNSFGIVSVLIIISFIFYESIGVEKLKVTDSTPIFTGTFPFLAGNKKPGSLFLKKSSWLKK